MDIKPGQVWIAQCSGGIILIEDVSPMKDSVWADRGYDKTVYFYSTIIEHFEYVGEL